MGADHVVAVALLAPWQPLPRPDVWQCVGAESKGFGSVRHNSNDERVFSERRSGPVPPAARRMQAVRK